MIRRALAALACFATACGGGQHAAAIDDGETTGDASAPPPASTERLVPPFAGDPPFANFFDHDVPREFVDTNGRQTTSWGEASVSIDGHDGYDFTMPEGTDVLAAASGTVTVAGAQAPFACPLLGGAMVSALVVRIEPDLADGARYATTYLHLSRVDVTVGQRVAAGDRVGLSGNTGCSTGPHLHFGTYRQRDGGWVVVDPYGWSGSGPDPWIAAGGAESTNLWAEGRAPRLHRDATLPLAKNGSSWVAITDVRWMGVDDAHHPENEHVELTRDDRFAPASVSLAGYSLANHAGEVVALPAVSLTAAHPVVRVHSGAGASTADDVYLGRTAPLWSDLGDCARLVFPNGNAYHDVFGGASCP